MSVDFQRLSDEFSELTFSRYKTGEKEYGPVAFLKNPVVKMAAEELADLANYARFAYIKLRIQEEILIEHGIDLGAELQVEVEEEEEPPHGKFIPQSEVINFTGTDK